MNTPLSTTGFCTGRVMWPPEDDQRALRMHKDGKTPEQIARALNRTKSGVLSRLRKLLSRVSGQTRQLRPCLCCRTPFISEGAHNRLCPTCSTKSISPFAP